MYGETHGVEVAAHWKLTDRWSVNPGYVFEKIHMHLNASSQDSGSVAGAEGSSPVHSAQVRSQFAISHNLNWNTSAYFSGRLSDPAEASYTRLDTGLSWQFAERNSFSIVGQNLLRDHHLEFVDSTGSAQTALLKRSVFAQFTVRF
jgi:iron complex outermembrane recepter protein